MSFRGFFKNLNDARQTKAKFVLLVITVLVCELLYLQLSGCAFEGMDDQEQAREIISTGKAPADIMIGFERGFIVQFAKRFNALPLKGVNLNVEREFRLINGIKAHLTFEQVIALCNDPDVIWISPDREIRASSIDPGLLQETTGASEVMTPTWSKGNLSYSGYTGDGVGIAIIDSGIYAHTDLGSRITHREDWVNDQTTGDPYGHGTHVAGIAAGNGYSSISHSYDDNLAGVAPEADLIDLRVLDDTGAGSTSDVVDAIEWAVDYRATYDIRILNLSFGMAPTSSYINEPITVALKEAIKDYDMVAVVCAGNYGEYNGSTLYGGIVIPGTNPYVITVGAADTDGTAVRSDDEVAGFSSNGPTAFDGVPKPELVAPGTTIKSLLSPSSELADDNPSWIIDPCDEGATLCSMRPDRYFKMTGTSMSAPIVSGTVALMLEANSSLTPNAVKAILMTTAEDLGEDDVRQGAGLVNIDGAVELASKVDDLDTLDYGDSWLTGIVNPQSTIAGETIGWAQGVTWVDIISGLGTWKKYQSGYGSGVLWGAGVTWVDITVQYDPVWDSPYLSIWEDDFIDPFDYDGLSNTVYSHMAFTSAPGYIEDGDTGYPEE